MRKVIEKICDGVVKEWGMIVALVLLAMPPMLCSSVFLGGLHSGMVNGFSVKLWEDQLMYPFIDMGILLFEVIITAVVVHLIGGKLLKWLVYGICILLAAIRMWLWWVFRMSISPQTFQLLMETNSQESAEFMQVYLIGWYGIGFILIILSLTLICFLVEWLCKHVEIRYLTKKIIVGICVVFICWGIVEMRWDIKLLKCKCNDDVEQWQNEICYNDKLITAFNFQSVIYSVVSMKSIDRDMFLCSVTSDKINKCKQVVKCDETSLVVVFVLGESHIKSHSSLYKYKLNTSPLLNIEKEKGNLFVFYDVISSFTSTSNAVKSIFFTARSFENWHESVFFPQLFRMSGFEVDMWDNQRYFCAKEDFTMNMTSVLFSGAIKRNSYSNISKVGLVYDEILIDDYIDNAFDLNCNRFEIFHLNGQHINAKDRFPHTKENLIFKGDDEKSEVIAMYDNACVYNDKVLAKIIDVVRDKKSVVVYLSDHGEEVYDYRDCYGRRAAEPGLEKEFLKYQAEVPFMIWCSDKYKEAYPEIVEDIEKSVDKPFITDNVCQVMFHLAGLKSPWYKEERDLLSDKYKCGKRIVNGEYDYDEVMSRK